MTALIIDRTTCNGCGACAMVLFDLLGGPDETGRVEIDPDQLRHHRTHIDQALNSCKTGALVLMGG